MKMSKIPKMVMSLILTASLILGLVMIPGFNSYASSYPATTSFTYTYQGYDYQFYFSGEVDSPQDYVFDSSVLDYLINKASEGLNLSISSGLGAKIDWLSGIVLNSVFDFYRNFVVATDKVIADWIVWSDIYGFSFEFTGLDANYPGYETYGSAYGWRFTGWLGEKIDLVLDSQGMLYGSNPIGNYTFSEDQQDFGQWSIHQHDGDDIWLPQNDGQSYQSLLAPYIQGDSLIFYLYYNGVPYKFELQDFANTYISVHWSGYNFPVFYFYNSSKSVISQYTLINHDNYPNVNFYMESPRFYLDNDRAIRPCALLNFNNGGSSYPSDFILPNFYSQGSTLYMSTAVMLNSLGYYNSNNISGSYKRIFLSKLTTSPLPDPIVLPIDDPVPVSDIQPDPVDFTPDPDDDPDPIPGIDYPVPGPEPFPVPPLPPLVSGNDDLWPDLNDVFTIEADLDGFLGGLSNFQFTPLRTLVDGFTSALTWVSTIMMLLYDGSDFSILFIVLSVFFIAAALLGIYKWWTR